MEGKQCSFRLSLFCRSAASIFLQLHLCVCMGCVQGRNDGGGYIGIYIPPPPNQSTLNFYVVVLSPWPRTNSISCQWPVCALDLYPPKSNSWLRPWLCVYVWPSVYCVCCIGE